MRYILIILLSFSLATSNAQWKSFFISVKGDTLNRVDLKGLKQGPWVLHEDEVRGEQGYDEQGYFADDKKDGIWIRFSLMGDKVSAENYRWGVLDGKAQYYNRTGELMREEHWRAVDPTKTYDTVDVMDVRDPSKVIDRVVVKLEGQTMKHGTWTYYDTEWGTITKTEEYFMNKIRTGDGVPGEDDDLKPLDATGKSALADKKAPAKPQAILDYEKKNSGKKRMKVRDGSTGN